MNWKGITPSLPFAVIVTMTMFRGLIYSVWSADLNAAHSHSHSHHITFSAAVCKDLAVPNYRPCSTVSFAAPLFSMAPFVQSAACYDYVGVEIRSHRRWNGLPKFSQNCIIHSHWNFFERKTCLAYVKLIFSLNLD